MNPTLNGKRGTYSPMEQAEREERVFRKWTDSYTPGTTDALILTQTAFNIPANAIAFITQLACEIETVNDDADFVLLRCSGLNGSGTTEQISQNISIASGAANQAFDGDHEEFVPAIPVKQRDGWNSIVLQVTAGDASVTIDGSFAGYWELEL